MNVILPLFLLLIANLVIYWIFFGKAKFEKKIARKIQSAALSAHQALGCSGFSRVDMIFKNKIGIPFPQMDVHLKK